MGTKLVHTRSMLDSQMRGLMRFFEEEKNKAHGPFAKMTVKMREQTWTQRSQLTTLFSLTQLYVHADKTKLQVNFHQSTSPLT